VKCSYVFGYHAGGNAMKQKKSRHPTDVHVGSRVRMRRLMLDMSQEKLGDALGIAASLFSRFRNTRRA
jgi:hypothetical protein